MRGWVEGLGSALSLYTILPWNCQIFCRRPLFLLTSDWIDFSLNRILKAMTLLACEEEHQRVRPWPKNNLGIKGSLQIQKGGRNVNELPRSKLRGI